MIGRSRDCDITVEDANVSRRHAEIRAEDGAYWLVDLGSTNGVELNGKRVERERLEHGDSIVVGKTQLTFERSCVGASVEQLLLGLQALFLVFLYLFIWRVIRGASRDLRVPQESFIMAPAQVTRHAACSRHVGGLARLVVVSSSSVPVGSSHDVGPVPVTIGRSDENTITLDGDEYASGHHARIEAGRDGVWLHDLHSTNGTSVNGEPVEGRRRLHEGDVVRVGETELRFEQ